MADAGCTNNNRPTDTTVLAVASNNLASLRGSRELFDSEKR